MSETKYAEKGMTCPLCLASWNGQRWHSNSLDSLMGVNKTLYIERDSLQSENSRLRKALKDMHDEHCESSNCSWTVEKELKSGI